MLFLLNPSGTKSMEFYSFFKNYQEKRVSNPNITGGIKSLSSAGFRRTNICQPHWFNRGFVYSHVLPFVLFGCVAHLWLLMSKVKSKFKLHPAPSRWWLEESDGVASEVCPAEILYLKSSKLHCCR